MQHGTQTFIIKTNTTRDIAAQFYFIFLTQALYLLTSQKITFVTTPNVENKVWSSCETLESIDEMKLTTNTYLWLHNFSEFRKLFSRAPMINCFRFYFRQLLIYLAFGKCRERTVIYLKVFWHKGFFCPFKTEIAQFPIQFRFNSYEVSRDCNSTEKLGNCYQNPLNLKIC